MKKKILFVLFVVAIAAIMSITMMSCEKDDPKTDPPIICIPDTPITDFEGNTYNTVKIGNQIWMAENLKSTHYSDGSPITTFSYGNDEANVLVYGRLYTWSATMKGAASSNSNPSHVQGVAPVGWHIPSRAEWQQLIDYLGGESEAGGKMKEEGIAHWTSPNEGATNESKFNALPAGMYAFWNEFQWEGDYCAFTSTTDNSVTDHPAYITVKLNYNNTQATMGDFHPDDAVSVRCVKD